MGVDMKITHAVIMVGSALLLAGGCAPEQQHQARHEGIIAPAYSPDGTRLPDSYYGENAPNNTPKAANKTQSPPYVSREPPCPPSAHVKRSDNSIAADAREALLRNAEIAAIVPNIQITANNGVLRLSGSAQSEEQTRQIQSIVGRTKGVVAVNNQLQFPGKTTSEAGNGMGNDE